jgi:hypothetical protein
VANTRPKNNQMIFSRLRHRVCCVLSHGWKIADFLGINAYYYELNLRKFAKIAKKSCEFSQIGGGGGARLGGVDGVTLGVLMGEPWWLSGVLV